MDQCQNCTAKGDFKKCKEATCSYHELWFTKQLEKRNEKLFLMLSAVMPLETINKVLEEPKL